ncbi:UDP-N-acetylglucosamine transferase subunit ALG14 homolog isoform X1 [Syngnathoides biaculeatus]|uniref:UDP-N-acetylglucosamine transferase subunit ALG14 homolog isoform X1 n=1 Tax=Syngnathoides biaculeatus TaxID=300417 RepID=UPI002ADE7E0F|nr:UDP-N-acetylglucosamine transferase subunit ALG14 homolog isoform X1 [Syngnathoides biaculeatus]
MLTRNTLPLGRLRNSIEMSLDSPMTGRVLFSVDVTVMTILLGSVFVVIACLLFIIRLYIVVRNGQNRKPGNKGRITLLIVAGSGGHTAEILRLMKSLSSAYSPRIYVIADTDRMSEERIRAFEKSKLLDCDPQFTIHRITRSREVHQSWISSVRSTLNAQFYSIPLIFRIRPDMDQGTVDEASKVLASKFGGLWFDRGPACVDFACSPRAWQLAASQFRVYAASCPMSARIGSGILTTLEDKRLRKWMNGRS